jgi:hypothetical protein
MTSAAATATAEPTTFEERLINALTSDISADDLYTLVEETKLAITTANNEATIAKATALDPLQSPDASEARRSMEDAKFKTDRLRNLLLRLQTRLIEAGNHEDYLRWRKRFDPLKPKVDVAAEKLKAVYQKFAAELVPLLAEIEKIDVEVSQVSLAKPYHAKAATNDGCFLRSVELTARGLDGFGTYGHKIMEIQLPDWEQQNKLMWPPDRHVDYSQVVPTFRHPGGDWWRVKEEEEARKRAEATRHEAEHQQQEGCNRELPARAADDRRRGIIEL